MKSLAVQIFTIKSAKVFTFSDQIIVTGSNFLLAVLITKLCGIAEFGFFASAWLWILFMSSIQQGFILIPMITLFYKNQTHDYLNRVAKLQGIFSILSILFILLASCLYNLIAYSVIKIDEIVLLIALLSGFFLWNEYIRKRYFLLELAKNAVKLDTLVYVFPLVLILFFPSFFNHLNRILYLLIGFQMIGFSINCSVLFYKSKYRSITLLFQRHWRTGYYLILSSLLQWFAGNSFLVVGSSLLPSEDFGAIRIGQSIIGICTVFFQYLENSTPLDLGVFIQKNGTKYLFKYVVKQFFINALLLSPFLIAILLFKSELIGLLFNAKMNDTNAIIQFLCLLQIFVLIGMFVRFYLRAIEKNRIIFIGYIVASIFSISSSTFLVSKFGLDGVLIGLLIHQISLLLPFIFQFKSIQNGND